MSSKIGLYTGSFDPVTNGHMDIIKRASHLFDQLYVGIFYNPNKKGSFSIRSRVQILEEALQEMDNVIVVTAENQLAVELAKDLSITHFVRGLRNATDFDYEANLDYFNHQLAPTIDTIYLISDHQLQPISSSRIRELIHFGASIHDFVPQSVLNQVEKEKNENS